MCAHLRVDSREKQPLASAIQRAGSPRRKCLRLFGRMFRPHQLPTGTVDVFTLAHPHPRATANTTSSNSNPGKPSRIAVYQLVSPQGVQYTVIRVSLVHARRILWPPLVIPGPHCALCTCVEYTTYRGGKNKPSGLPAMKPGRSSQSKEAALRGVSLAAVCVAPSEIEYDDLYPHNTYSTCCFTQVSPDDFRCAS